MLTVDGHQAASSGYTLEETAASPDTDSVAVLAHVPPNDKSAQQVIQLGDRPEAEVVEEWLTDFELSSGDESVHIGAYAGYFDTSHFDGVSYWLTSSLS